LVQRLLDGGIQTRHISRYIKKLIGQEFSIAVIDWGLYWPEVEFAQSQFNFSNSDNQVSLAQKQNMVIRGHSLVFPTSSYGIADWVVKGNFTRDQLVEILRNHISRLVSHYQGKVKEWIVVNEPYISPYRPNDVFYKTLGANYIEIAFQAARETDLSAILIYNDTENHTSAGITTHLTRKNLQLIASKGLVDGVGLQMHLDGARPPSKSDVVATMKSYDMPVYITEMDVNMQDVAGTQDDRHRIQATIYREMLEACLESAVCKSITFWGIGDKYSWGEWPKDAPHVSPNADMTLFDDYLKPKPAYYALYEVFSQYVAQKSTVTAATSTP